MRPMTNDVICLAVVGGAYIYQVEHVPSNSDAKRAKPKQSTEKYFSGIASDTAENR